MKNQQSPVLSRKAKGFSLVEILVSLAVLAILLLINVQVIDQVQNTWAASNARVSQFKEARTAFDILVRNLSQATLNTYLDYDSNYVATAASSAGAATTTAQRYLRKSDLQFICGPSSTILQGDDSSFPGHSVFFQAPLGVTENPNYVGLDRLLCGRGYFVQFSSDAAFRPSFLPPGNFKFRYRLMEYSPPAEKNRIYSVSRGINGQVTGNWFDDAKTAINAGESAVNVSKTRPVADNILALIISPRLEKQVSNAILPTSIAPSYSFNSADTGGSTPNALQGTQHLLPPLVKLILIAIDERSAQRLAEQTGSETVPPFGATLSSPFKNASALETSEIAALVQTLAAKNVNYRVFSATVAIRGSKWGI